MWYAQIATGDELLSSFGLMINSSSVSGYTTCFGNRIS